MPKSKPSLRAASRSGSSAKRPVRRVQNDSSPADRPPDTDRSVRINLPGSELTRLSLGEARAMQREAMRWSYSLRNRERWNRQVESGNRWTIPVGPETIAAARQGQWSVLLTETKPVPRALGIHAGGSHTGSPRRSTFYRRAPAACGTSSRIGSSCHVAACSQCPGASGAGV